MFLYFKQTVNDKEHAGRAFLSGRTYEIEDERAEEILKAIPELVCEALPDKQTAKELGVEPKKKTKKKKTKKEPVEEVEDPIADELERECVEFVEMPPEE